ncbi:6-hydroxy-D-nicotine oxidase [Coleophoma cylindrospora]|uniref:6-hydroxy-D-nicotine oxidase n=1 Tax=Coleophoma cylindrospora TaxID=1849047 RepID=A0A3D8QSS2_9HELO|nr:6-hydroxy-D-nicotine oxidase [Coleophoma cylindrospora]
MRFFVPLAFWAATVSATAGFEGRRYDFAVPSTPVATFNDNFTSTTEAIASLKAALSANASVAAPLSLQYGSTVARVWPKQLETWPEAIVYPSTPEDVSIIMQFYSKYHGLWDEAFAIMCGGHFSSGGAQTKSLIIDLQFLNAVILNDPVDASERAIVKIGGGTKSGHVYDELDGTGWAFLGARSTTIGTGGFTLGGGIAYQTGRYGIGADNLVGVEMVLLNGTIIYANPYNNYSDIFWACTGGGWAATIGVVTNFYSQAYPDPGEVQVGAFVYSESKKDAVFPLVNNFFENNTDVNAFPAFVYYFKDPDYPSAVAPITEREFVLQFNAMYFGSIEGFNTSYAAFYENANSVSVTSYSLKNLKEFLSSNYPYGQSTIFRGKSHTNVSNDLWENTLSIYKETIQGLLARGEDPANSLWVSEYMYPNWNGAGASNDSATAWPHSTSAHITLSSLMWSNQSNANYVDERDEVMMDYLREYQAGVDSAPIYDYPNYLAPYSKPSEVWGTDNFNRLVEIKEKYDPECLISRGVVIPTTACQSKGLVNYSLDN